MQRVTIVQYTTKPGRAEENEALSRAVFAELKSRPRQPIVYALLRHGDDFMHLFLNLESEDADGLVELDSFKAFSAGGADRWTGAPEIARRSLQLIDVYGVERATAPA